MKVNDNGQCGLHLLGWEEVNMMTPSEMTERKEVIGDHLHSLSREVREAKERLDSLSREYTIWWKQKEALERRLTEVRVMPPKRDRKPTKREETLRVEVNLTAYLASLSNEELEDLVERLKEEGRYE